jgi:hypothetical protein
VVFVDVVVVALLVGTLAGGRLATLADTPIKGMPLAFAAIALQVVAFPSGVLPWAVSSSAARVLWLVSYALLLAMLVVNRRLFGLPIVAAGLLSNLAAILANGGLMPVRASALAAAHRIYSEHNNSVALVRPHLGALVDRWAVPHWIPLGNVYSVGDVLIAIGIFLAVVAAMRSTRASDTILEHESHGQAPSADRGRAGRRGARVLPVRW